jgi:hypothetical protein
MLTFPEGREAAARGNMMRKVFLFGIAALAIAASGAQAKAPPRCHDAKGRVIPCAQAPAPKQQTSSLSGDECLWLISHGLLVPCTII